eukprot:10321439-Prorocentrum_lima.AAC.1
MSLAMKLHRPDSWMARSSASFRSSSSIPRKLKSLFFRRASSSSCDTVDMLFALKAGSKSDRSC